MERGTTSMNSREPEDRLRLVIDTTPALLHSALPDGDIDFFNQRMLDYLGAPMEELCGWPWTTFIHRDDVEQIVNKWRLSLDTGEPFESEARVRRADGKIGRASCRERVFNWV